MQAAAVSGGVALGGLTVAPAAAARSQRRAAATRCAAAPDAAAPSRRAALGAALGVALAAAAPRPADAAYGEAARVFGAKTKLSEFTTFVGDGYFLEIPSKWNPDKSIIVGSDLRYADNMRDDGANLDVIIAKTDKKSIKDYGSLDAFLPMVSYLLGTQSFDGATESEGGFASGKVVAGSILEQDTLTSNNGKSFYYYHILTRTADGEGGGRHHLLLSGISGDKIYTLQVQALDKQWFKGGDRLLDHVVKSFALA